MGGLSRSANLHCFYRNGEANSWSGSENSCLRQFMMAEPSIHSAWPHALQRVYDRKSCPLANKEMVFAENPFVGGLD